MRMQLECGDYWPRVMSGENYNYFHIISFIEHSFFQGLDFLCDGGCTNHP